jgi:hypothetical protein
MYKATLENNITSTYNFTVDSDAAASIHIYNDSEMQKPIRLWIYDRMK